jgi:hypothetical protein
MRKLKANETKQIAYNMAIGVSPMKAVTEAGVSASRAEILEILETLRHDSIFNAEIKYYENLVQTNVIERLATQQAQKQKNIEAIEQLKAFYIGVINFDISDHLEESTARYQNGVEETILTINSMEELKKACPYIKRMKFTSDGTIIEFYDKMQVGDLLMKAIDQENKTTPQDISISYSLIKETNPNRELIMNRINAAISNGDDF